MVAKQILHRGSHADRTGPCRSEKRAKLVELADQSRVAFSIFLRIPGNFRNGRIQIEPHRDLLAIGQRDMGNGVRVKVRKSILAHQTELV